MKFIRILLFSLFFAPIASFGATPEFTMAAQLLAAAKNADVQQVQSLVNAGADINFVDATGLSIVCTALMNNDVRAAQILQMYGADASKCDNQIKIYNNRTKPKPTGGLFSGLSSAQNITLAAAGAAVVVGGLFLLTDVFDPGNENNAVQGGGSRPDNNPNDGGTSGPGSLLTTVPYSPVYVNKTDGKVDVNSDLYQKNLEGWLSNPMHKLDFNYFNPSAQPENNYIVDGITNFQVQNYLLMMHGYSSFANGYTGMGIFRDATTKNPLWSANGADGGEPVSVSLVTANGLNPTGSAARGNGILYATSAAADAQTYLVDKYLNYDNPNQATNALGEEKTFFDLSGSGTAMNPFASVYDSALGKFVAGWEGAESETDARSYGDFYGFVPDGRLGIFRTGNGQQWVNIDNPTSGTVVGTLSDANNNDVIGSGDVIVLNGVTYNLSLAIDDAEISNPVITIGETTYKLDKNSKMLLGKCATDGCTDSDIAIYQDTDGLLYVNTSGGNTIDAVYVLNNGNLYNAKTLQDAAFRNFEALRYAYQSTGSDVIANVSVLEASKNANYTQISGVLGYAGLNNLKDSSAYVNLINEYYTNNTDTGLSLAQGAYASALFGGYGPASAASGVPMLVMPAGDFKFGTGDGMSTSVLDATFENYAPLVDGYDNLNHNFMTVVAVQHSGSKGTTEASTIVGYGDGIGTKYGPLYLSLYKKDGVTYSSRQCGISGVGGGNVDPWCFAAAGPTAEMATASAAGAVAAVKGAFGYMTNNEIFQLLALTSDGYLLATDAAGNAFTKDTLVTYLKQKYALPPEYFANTLSVDKYLDAFAHVYGYGLINLERAMTPGHSIYYYNGNKNKIVSADGNSYWRAASDTVFKPSATLNLRGASISAPFFDVLHSVDGQMSLPRVWENEFALGASDASALYMGDILGDLKTVRNDKQSVKIGNLDFAMAISSREYIDYMGGLDNLSLSYDSGNWNFGATYQRYLTDGSSRFSGLHNPIMGLISNAVTTDVKYQIGNWGFSGRAISGVITDEGLLENDPTIAAQYMPAKLGLAHGLETGISWNKNGLDLNTSVGVVQESNTLLGAYSDGLLNFGAGQTIYTDIEAKYDFSEFIELTMRATFANTVSDASGDFVLGLSEIKSNAFGIGLTVGNFDFSISQPLAITDGVLRYSYAKYDVTDNGNGIYNLNVIDAHVADLSLASEQREIRFGATYRHNFGEFTNGAIGFIYRQNPNNTDYFGDESVFMIKLTHSLGI